MSETSQEKLKAKRGRPVTGTAKTATERSQGRDATLVDAGGRVINRLRLSPEAAAALARFANGFPDERSAIEAALLAYDNIR
jgi:hypothetical protein